MGPVGVKGHCRRIIVYVTWGECRTAAASGDADGAEDDPRVGDTDSTLPDFLLDGARADEGFLPAKCHGGLVSVAHRLISNTQRWIAHSAILLRTVLGIRGRCHAWRRPAITTAARTISIPAAA